MWIINAKKLEGETIPRQGEGNPTMLTLLYAYHLILLPVLFFALAPGAYACIMCNSAISWQLFPPVFPWALIMLGWYFGYSLVVTMDGGQVLYIRRLPGSLAWFAPALFLAVFVTGPFIMFIFGALCLINFLVSLWPFPLLGWSSWLRWQVRVIGIIFIAALGYTAMTEYTAFRKMDEADFILKWDGITPMSQRFERLQKMEPDSIPLYRKLVREGKNFIRSRAAQRLAETGNREEDVPLLIEALADEYSHKPDEDHYFAHEISETLQKMTGIDLPREATPEVWREKWEAFNEKEGGKAELGGGR